MSRCEDCDEVTCSCQDRYPDTPSRIHDEAAYNAYWKDVDERAERGRAERYGGYLQREVVKGSGVYRLEPEVVTCAPRQHT